MKQDYTHITVIVDKSGSMQKTAGDTIGSINDFVQKQKEVKGNCSYQLVQFDNVVEVGPFFETIAEAPVLTTETYRPRGNTALLDAVGVTLNTLGDRLAKTPEAERPSKVIFVIMTDGEENSSKEFTSETINQMINHQRDVYKWEFVFLGANQDAIKVGTSLGVLAGGALTYTSGLGTSKGFMATNQIISNSRSGGGSIGSATNSYSQADRMSAVVDIQPLPKTISIPTDLIEKSKEAHYNLTKAVADKLLGEVNSDRLFPKTK